MSMFSKTQTAADDQPEELNQHLPSNFDDENSPFHVEPQYRDHYTPDPAGEAQALDSRPFRRWVGERHARAAYAETFQGKADAFNRRYPSDPTEAEMYAALGSVNHPVMDRFAVGGFEPTEEETALFLHRLRLDRAQRAEEHQRQSDAHDAAHTCRICKTINLQVGTVTVAGSTHHRICPACTPQLDAEHTQRRRQETERRGEDLVPGGLTRRQAAGRVLDEDQQR